MQAPSLSDRPSPAHPPGARGTAPRRPQLQGPTLCSRKRTRWGFNHWPEGDRAGRDRRCHPRTTGAPRGSGGNCTHPLGQVPEGCVGMRERTWGESGPGDIPRGHATGPFTHTRTEGSMQTRLLHREPRHRRGRRGERTPQGHTCGNSYFTESPAPVLSLPPRAGDGQDEGTRVGREDGGLAQQGGGDGSPWTAAGE